MRGSTSGQGPGKTILPRGPAFWRRASSAEEDVVPSAATPVGPFVFTLIAGRDTHAWAGRIVIPAERIPVPLATVGRFQATDLDAMSHHARGIVRFTSRYPDRQLIVPPGTVVTTRSGVAFQTTEGLILARPVAGRYTTEGDVPVEAVLAGPAGNIKAHAIQVVPAELKAAFVSVDNPRPTGGGQQAEIRRVGRPDFDVALAAAAERLAADLDQAAAALRPTHHALPATADFESTIAEPAAAEVVGRLADWVDLTVRTTAMITAVQIRDLEEAAGAHLDARRPAGAEIIAGSIAGRVLGAAVEGRSVIYTISVSAWQTFDADADLAAPAAPVAELVADPGPANLPPSSPDFAAFDLFGRAAAR